MTFNVELLLPRLCFTVFLLSIVDPAWQVLCCREFSILVERLVFLLLWQRPPRIWDDECDEEKDLAQSVTGDIQQRIVLTSTRDTNPTQIKINGIKDQ